MVMPSNIRPFDDHGPPRSTEPVSLEYLVKFKPGRTRGGNRSGRVLDNTTSENDTMPSINGELDYLQDGLSVESARTLNPNASHLRVGSRAFPGMTRSSATAGSREALNGANEDGAFRFQTLANGDISADQWSEDERTWNHIGQIAQGDVSIFTRFYDRSYNDHRSNPETWHLYKQHIITTVKNMDEKRRQNMSSVSRASHATQGRPGTPSGKEVPRSTELPPLHLKNLPYTSSKNVEAFPPLLSTINASASVPTRSNKALSQPQRDTAGQSQIREIDPSWSIFDIGSKSAYIGSQGSTAPRYNVGSVSDTVLNRTQSSNIGVGYNETEGRDETREFEGRRMLYNSLLQYQMQDSSKAIEESVQRLSTADSKHPMRQSLLTSDPFPQGMSLKDQDTRRTVLHDPLRATALSSTKRDKLEDRSIRNIDYGLPKHHYQTPIPLRMPVPRSFRTAATLKELVNDSQPESFPTKSVGFFAASNEPSGFRSGMVADASSATHALQFDHSKPSGHGGMSHASDDPLSKTYTDSLDNFWYSGSKRLKSYEGRINQTLARSREASTSEAQIGIRLWVLVLATLKTYQISRDIQQAGGRDQFSNYSKPPVWCVERRSAGKEVNTLFEENELVAATQRHEQDPRIIRMRQLGFSRDVAALAGVLRMPSRP